ncbi:DUF887-domain-containing protein [Dothidotthia symphoricarpi CBS 119687]|uniref:DUF887-domain-containing protein n=1 Tax=Dothidotthia symphoricarpi CBS 119687 TaxID=1392245 RepID=A0A6A6AIH9_9PLEO|nr:DUF887-domain-containing protein [Dothidotthia symphoricarpi CBS 119687]KAF2130231.1 DUF887-domain-containing protein [Dothidotthia symphoricarpi CBS 119687]
MHDPFVLAPPEALLPYIQPVADFLSLQTLPLHFHELVLAYSFYHVTNKYISPALSRYFFPRIYPAFNARTKLNWDVHVVSFVQSVVICALALWVMYADDERFGMDAQERVYGYTGASGLIQAFAGGYFLWDLVITLQNVQIFGIGMLLHAISALCVFGLGFRPFVNFYASSFILYELSSPFLNIHWFCDKLNKTGSTIQFLNGIALLITFFSCRIVWGSYQSVCVFSDVFQAYKAGTITLFDPDVGKLNTTTATSAALKTDMMRFAEGQTVPLWLAGAYLASNITLNTLNWFWFGKMIETLRSRFDPPFGTRRPEHDLKISVPVPEHEKVLIEGTHVSTPGATGTDTDEYPDSDDGAIKLEQSRNGTHLEVQQSEVRSRTSTRRRG